MKLRDPTTALAGLLAAAWGLLALRPLGAPDTWWHLSIGRHVLRTGHRVFAEPVGLPSRPEFVAGEWGFDVLAYTVHSLAGPGGLVLLAGAAAAASFLATWWMARQVAEAPWTALLVASGSASVTSVRFFPRPHILFLILLPLVIGCALRAVRSADRRPWFVALALLLAAWSQLHPSVIVAPAVIGAAGLPWVLGTPEPGRPHRLDRGLFATLAGLCLLPLLSPYGLGLIDQVLGHSGTDSVVHIGEMQPMPVDWWWPPENRSLALIELGLAAAILGSLSRGGVRLNGLALAALGLLLTLNTHRFRAAWSILLVPWLVDALRPRFDRREGRGRALGALAGAALLLVSAAVSWSGPRLGLDRAWVPVGLGQAVQGLPVQGPVFNDYDAGGYLGWIGDGALRVFIDGRTPPYFTDEHFFAARRALVEPAVFERLDASYGFSAAAIPRGAPLCAALDASERWQPVWVGEDRALFRPGPPGEPLRWVAPCAAQSSVPRCQESGPGPALTEVRASLALAPDNPWLARLGAVLALRCGAGDPAAAREFLDIATRLDPEHADIAWLRAQLSAPTEALRITAEARDARTWHLRLRLLAEQGSPSDVQAEARAFLAEFGDEAPPGARRILGDACAALGDEPCAARQWLRAALQGDEAAARSFADLRARSRLPVELERLGEAIP